jgi:hypothetical protein
VSSGCGCDALLSRPVNVYEVHGVLADGTRVVDPAIWKGGSGTFGFSFFPEGVLRLTAQEIQATVACGAKVGVWPGALTDGSVQMLWFR